MLLWDFSIARDLLLRQDWLAHDGGQLKYCLDKKDALDEVVSKQTSGENVASATEEKKDLDTDNERSDHSSDHLMGSHSLENNAPSMSDLEASSDPKDEEIAQLKKENAELKARLIELDSHMGKILEGLDKAE